MDRPFVPRHENNTHGFFFLEACACGVAFLCCHSLPHPRARSVAGQEAFLIPAGAESAVTAACRGEGRARSREAGPGRFP